MHARYYSFHTARFLSVDPVKGEVGSSQSWNRYAYVRGNPINGVDPDGRAIVLKLSENPETRALQVAAANDIATGGVVNPVSAPASGVRLVGRLVKGAFNRIKSLFSRSSSAAKGTKLAPRTIGAVKKTASSKSAREMAEELGDSLGKNRVTTQTSGGKRIDFDLRGKAHFDKRSSMRIETPHVHQTKVNVGPNGKVNLSEEFTREATKEDIRTVRKLLEKRGQ